MLSFQGKRHFLGSYTSEQVAARAHDVASVVLHGTDAETNFPKDGYDGAEDLSELSPAEFIVAMQRYALIGNKKNSR